MILKGGILIIGSLFWQDDQDSKPFHRRNWRNKQLLLKDRLHVFAPIRYGRLSKKEDNETFTMVLSKAVEEKNELGTAFVVPFKNSSIRSLKGIQNQARFLSEAEGLNDKKIVKGKKKWCAIGILFNPEIEITLKIEILNYWSSLIQKDGGFDPLEYCIHPESPIISSDGEILISWLKTVNCKNQNILDEFDFVLATCPKPTKYPSIEELQENIKGDKREYFYNNLSNGITTYIDNSVIYKE